MMPLPKPPARNVALAVIAWTVLVIAFGLEGCMLLGIHYPQQIAPELVGRILGTLDAAIILVLSYIFGSSAGGRANADTLGQIASAQSNGKPPAT